ncbi:FtsX-like permease family protein [Actinoallomurus sp. CA-142502]|uniref:FtsX-like permease family protein n=1 Tax=Actinoallomurus sp. CA-142502 TaxID=3239885 RepID=UPI003D911912
MSVMAPARSATGGGVPARRALVRWSWRLLRREWRSQALVTVLLMVAVMAAVCGGTAVYNVPQTTDSQLGSAGTMLSLDGEDPQAVADDLAILRHAVGAIDVVGHDYVKAPGSATPVEYRSQRMHGAFAGPLLAIRRGRYPSGTAEAAITDGTARLLGLRLGGTISLDGHARTIVGIAENPSDLSDEFVLVDPSSVRPRTLSVLVGQKRDVGAGSLHLRTASPMAEGVGSDNGKLMATTLVLAGAMILLLLIAFVAAAAFAVLAHRRLRQLGMLAAIGATGRQVRLVMTATGFLVGAVAAFLGTIEGLALWPFVAPRLENTVNHRIALSGIPWPLVVALGALAVAMSTGAAWRPARVASRVPVTAALSGRPPVPRRGHRSALLGAGLFAAGVGLLAWGQKTHPWPVAAGATATALAILFAGPPAIRVLAAAGRRAPVAVRLALRDLARHQARSGAAVAAISLALGIAAALVVLATDAQGTAETGNLGDRQMVIKATGSGPAANLVPVRTAAEVNALTAQVDRVASALDHPVTVPLDVPIDPDLPPQTDDGRPARMPAIFCLPRGTECGDIPLYVASPALLRFLGVDPAAVAPAADVLTGRSGRPVFPVRSKTGRATDVPVITRIHTPAYTSLPTSVITASGLARRHWTRARAGWLIQSGGPLTGEQIAGARKIAAAAGLTIETRTGHAAVQNIRIGATGVGMLLALGILAMTVGLIRSEAAADLRTLTAAGATRGIRRALTATTAGALALLGVVLGVAGACLGLLAVYRHDLAVFGRVPIGYPVGIVAGTPLAAAIAGWLLAGREPPSIARRMGE